MKRAGFYVRLYKEQLHMGMITMTQYPLDSIIWIISMIGREGANFLGVFAIARAAGGIGGWNLYEICIIFAMGAMIEAVSQTFLDSVWQISSNIRKGGMDVMLIRPAGVLFQLLGSRFQFQALFSLAASMSVFVFSCGKLGIHASPGGVLFVLEFLICGTIINSSVYLIFNCLNFWIVQGKDISVLVQTFREFAKYPVSVFPIVIRGILTFAVPFGFIGYYPAAYMTGRADFPVPAVLLIMAAVTGTAGITVWRYGLKGYNSTGT